MLATLQAECGFQSNSSNTRKLTEDEPSHMHPTRDNIIAGCRWLLEDIRPGDTVFFMYSGHGGQRRDQNGDEKDGKDECLCPVDGRAIIDDELNEILCQPLPAGCTLYAVIDACHSGSMLDLAMYLDPDTNAIEKDKKAATLRGTVFSVSGCMDNQTSADTTRGGVSGGAVTIYLTQMMKDTSCDRLSWADFSRELNRRMSRMSQKPTISFSRSGDLNEKFMASAHN
jgi:hypothetical protein